MLAGAPGASADSGSEATFEALSHDTDFTPFEQGGLYGFDTAIMADGAYYHSPLDDPAHLSAASLQQMGDTTLALTRELAGMDLGVIADGGEEIVPALPWGLLRYPQSLEVPLAIGVLVLVAVLVWVLRRRGALTLPRAALSVAASVVLLVAAGAAGYAVWRVALLVDPAQASAVVGEPYRPLLLPAGDAARRAVGRRLGVRAAPSATGCRRPRRRHARRARPRRRAAGGHRARTVRDGGATGARRGIGAVVAVLLPERRTAARAGVYLVALAVPRSCSDRRSGSASTSGSVPGPSVRRCSGCSSRWRCPWSRPPDRGRPARPGRKAPGAGFGVAVAADRRTHRRGLVANREGATDARQEQIVYSVDADYAGRVLGLGGRAGE